MIIFYSDTGFEHNLTNLDITFIEENNLFYDSFFKNYSLPFSVPLDDETSVKFGLIDMDNIANYKVKYTGKLLIDYNFEDAYFIIEEYENDLQATLYFGTETLPLLETKLSDLPFPIIKTTSLKTYANSILDKKWPEVPCNFPMVFDDEFNNETNYEDFEGIINQYNGYYFIENILNEEGTPLNKNIMMAFPYLMEVLKVGFNSAGLEMTGDFTSTKRNQNILITPTTHLESFSTTTYDNYQFSQTTDEYILNESLVYEYKKQHSIQLIGTYNLNIVLNLPKSINMVSFTIEKDSETIYIGDSNSIEETITVNNEDATTTKTLTVTLIIEPTEEDISNYNNFEFEKSEGKLNIFKDTFSLSELMPDITFGTLLTKVKNWQNLKIDINTNYVVMDYIEKNFENINYIDESEYEIKTPKRKFNQSKVYKLQYSEDNYLLISKDGRINSTDGFLEENINEINADLEILNIEERDSIFSAVNNTDADFSLLLYNGTNSNNLPVAVDNIDGFTFNLQDIYYEYWEKWLNFRLLSETYTDEFNAHALDNFDINNGSFKYNKKHIKKTITRKRVSEEQWEYTIETETI